MNVRLSSRIAKYKEKGWRVEEDPEGIAMWGVGYLESPRGNCFTFEEMRENGGMPPWDVDRDEDVKEARRFARFYELVNEFCSSCYLGRGIERLYEEVQV